MDLETDPGLNSGIISPMKSTLILSILTEQWYSNSKHPYPFALPQTCYFLKYYCPNCNSWSPQHALNTLRGEGQDCHLFLLKSLALAQFTAQEFTQYSLNRILYNFAF